MLTRTEASKELKKRGYKEDKEPGIWVSPDGSRLAWFIALQREGIEFDSNTWGPEITRAKYEWKEKKRLAKLKLKNSTTKGFTLLELLITISIIFILASLLATATSRAKEAGQRAQCLNNARVLNMTVKEGMPVIFGNTKDNRSIRKMRNYGDVIVVNCYSCHPNIIDFDRKEKLYPLPPPSSSSSSCP